jgi:nitrate reductase beta subunit
VFTGRRIVQMLVQRMKKIENGPNWEEILGGEFSKRSQDKNFDNIQKDAGNRNRTVRSNHPAPAHPG